MGARAHVAFPHYEHLITDGIALEVGCSMPNPDSSSQYFAEYFSKNTREFHGIDIEQRKARVLGSLYPEAKFWACDWRKVFETFTQPIAFAYLDGFDYIPPGGESWPIVLRQMQVYRKRGVELTNENSAQFHLEIAQAIHERAAEHCVIMMDDTFQAGYCKVFQEHLKNEDPDTWMGKGATAVPWLLQNGWTRMERIQLPWAPADPADDWEILTNILSR